MEAARRLYLEGVRVEDIAVRRPTLDDVFLSLTGHASATADEPADTLRTDDLKEVAA
jgi:ABC-2 type transport system ATP-binding protein